MVKNIQTSMLKVMETKTLELMHVRSHLGDKWNDVADTFAKRATMPGDVEVVTKTAAWYQQYPMEDLDEALLQEPVIPPPMGELAEEFLQEILGPPGR